MLKYILIVLSSILCIFFSSLAVISVNDTVKDFKKDKNRIIIFLFSFIVSILADSAEIFTMLFLSFCFLLISVFVL